MSSFAPASWSTDGAAGPGPCRDEHEAVLASVERDARSRGDRAELREPRLALGLLGEMAADPGFALGDERGGQAPALPRPSRRPPGTVTIAPRAGSTTTRIRYARGDRRRVYGQGPTGEVDEDGLLGDGEFRVPPTTRAARRRRTSCRPTPVLVTTARVVPLFVSRRTRTRVDPVALSVVVDARSP